MDPQDNKKTQQGDEGTPTPAQPPQGGGQGTPTPAQPPQGGGQGTPTPAQPPQEGGQGTPTPAPQQPPVTPPPTGTPQTPPPGGFPPPQAGTPPPPGAYPPGAYPPGVYPPPQAGAYPPPAGTPPGMPPGTAPQPPQEDTTPANFQLGEKLPKELKVKVPKNDLKFDEDHFIRLLAGSISLSKDEKKKIIDSIPKLKQAQVDELIRIFEEEKQKFAALSKKHVPQLTKLADQHYNDWMALEGEYEQQDKKKEDEGKADEIRKQLGI